MMKIRSLIFHNLKMLLAAIVMHLPVQAQPREAVFNGYCHSFRFLVGTASSAGLNFDMLFTSYDGKASIPLFDKDSSGYAIFSDEVMPSFGEPGVYRTDYVLYVNNNYNAAGTISATLPTVDTDQNGIADFLQKNQQGNLAISGKLLRQVPSLAPEIAISGQIARSAGTSQGVYSIGGRDPEIGDITYKGNLYLVNLIGKFKYNRTNKTATVEADLDREGGAVIKYTNQLNYSVSDTNTISFPSGKFSATNQLDVLHKAFILKRSGNRYIGRLDFEDAYKGTSWADYTAWQLEIVDTNDSDGDGVPDLSDPPAIQTPPTIVLQPVSQTRAVGEAVDLRVQAVGTGLLSYAWKKNGVPVLNLGGVSGANASTLSFASVQPSQAGNYSVVVSNAFGMVTSAVATLSIKVAGVAPAFVAQPQPVTVPAGQMAVFTVVATGTEPLGYQWQRNGINLPGANASTLTINQPQAVDAGDYRVVVSNAAGSVTSSIAKLIVEGSQTTSRASAFAVIRGGLVSSVTVTDGGGGYVSEPSVSLNGGGGTGATAKAFIENGRVVAIVVLNSGSGYTGTPTVTIDAPSKSLGLKIELISKLTVEGPVGQSALVEWAGELGGPWAAWSNVVVGIEGTVLVDLRPGALGRFYRARLEAGSPASAGFVWIPPGTFMMGSPASEANRSTNEVQHTVTLTQGFWLSDHEVTQAEYQAVMGNNPSRFKGDTLPVETVSWDDAVLYCQKLTERERAAGRITAQQAYRLPTESEWEYAARAGTTGERHGELDAIGWHGGNSGYATHEVKGKQANAWGLHDMIGNVWEWCGDWYGEYPTGSVTDPRGPSSGSNRVLRGGSWYDVARYARSAGRGGSVPGSRGGNVGFRPALSSIR